MLGLLGGAIVPLGCASGSSDVSAPAVSPERPVATQVASGRAVVVAGHPEAASIGREILARGGSAADAAVAVSLALGVAEPYGSGLGGKLALVYHDVETDETFVVEALDQAGGAFTPELAAGLDQRQRTEGWSAVAVPGLVAGLETLHSKAGRLEWSALVLPVALLAEDGATVLPRTVDFFARRRDRILVSAAAATLFLPGGELPRAGTRLPNPDLAKTLRAIATGGAAGFYRGWVAEAIVRDSDAFGGAIRLEDLAGYHARITTPLQATYEGYEIATVPPPASGGATVLLALHALARVSWDGDRLATPHNLDLLASAFRRTYPWVQDSVGDVTGARRSVENKLAEEASPSAWVAPTARGFVRAPLARAADGATTHFVVVDAQGSMASVTQSLSHHFGAGVVARGTGVLMNNTLTNFNYAAPGSVNAPGPHKRPRTTIAPVLARAVAEDGDVLALGLPGGQRIPTATVQVLVDTLVFDRSLEQTIAAPRFHLHRDGRGEGANEIELEMPNEPLMRALAELGWETTWNRDTETFGGFCAARRSRSRAVGVADLRRTNRAVALD